MLLDDSSALASAGGTQRSLARGAAREQPHQVGLMHCRDYYLFPVRRVRERKFGGVQQGAVGAVGRARAVVDLRVAVACVAE